MYGVKIKCKKKKELHYVHAEAFLVNGSLDQCPLLAGSKHHLENTASCPGPTKLIFTITQPIYCNYESNIKLQ